MKNIKTYIYPIITTLLTLGLMTLVAFRYPILSALSLPIGVFWPILVGLVCLTAVAAFFMLQDWKKSLALPETYLPNNTSTLQSTDHRQKTVASNHSSTTAEMLKDIKGVMEDYRPFAWHIVHGSKSTLELTFDTMMRKTGEVQCFHLAIKYGRTNDICHIANNMKNACKKLDDGLMTAIEAGKLPSLEALRQSILGPDIIDTISGDHLLLAAQYGNVDIIRWLYEHSELDPSDLITQTNGTSPLLEAAANNHVEATVHLLQQGGKSVMNHPDGQVVLNYAKKHEWSRETINSLKQILPTILEEAREAPSPW